MMNKWVLTCLVALCAVTTSAAATNSFDVVWDSPSRDCHGSVPLGNGDISLNAWVEPSADLVFYIGKTDSWDDNARLLKIGKVRVTLDPAPSVRPFQQELSLETGSLNVRYGDGTTLRVWVDANHPTIHVEVEAEHPVTATARAEIWRTNRLELPSIECSDVLTDRSRTNGMHGPTIVEPDTVLTGLVGQVGWFHHNVKSVGPALHAEIQGVTGFQRQEPLLHRTFGALMTSPRAQRLDDRTLQPPAGTAHQFAIHVLTRHPASPESWLRDLNALVTAEETTPLEQRRQAHEAWWRAF